RWSASSFSGSCHVAEPGVSLGGRADGNSKGRAPTDRLTISVRQFSYFLVPTRGVPDLLDRRHEL
ncbi:MAG: hypothetical protein AAFO01_12790, partial [Pseudomonadota bacterium]